MAISSSTLPDLCTDISKAVDALEMERMLMVGLLCVHPDSEKRPRVRDAARILNCFICVCACSPSVCRTLAHASNGWHLTVPSSVGTEVTSFHWREQVEKRKRLPTPFLIRSLTRGRLKNLRRQHRKIKILFLIPALHPPLLDDTTRIVDLSPRLRTNWYPKQYSISTGQNYHMSLSLLQPSFLMSKTRSYALILIGSRLFLTAMAIHLSLRVAPLDLQQGGNSRILYVHVPAARMSILVYIATAINTFLFLLTKHPLSLRSSGTGTEMGAFFTLFTLVTGGFRGRPMWGTFWVWDARLTSVFISFLIYLGALRFQKLPVEPAPISIRAGPIDIPIIKSSVNWWNTLHQPGSISRSGTSIHVPMPIPILSNFANFPLSTRILFVLETRLPILSFPESPLRDEIEAREGIAKPSLLPSSN
ncbi:hypothetical protein VNO80_33995 [Phaseolus coccineus]|uniref:Cytochrome c assembly protein domain-containing protein n=3 Tax=Phaseolus coccineus TaxID=3886 RepID=A0AAN9KYM0_PHACN